jgi:hypothetical protein
VGLLARPPCWVSVVGDDDSLDGRTVCKHSARWKIAYVSVYGWCYVLSMAPRVEGTWEETGIMRCDFTIVETGTRQR